MLELLLGIICGGAAMKIKSRHQVGKDMKQAIMDQTSSAETDVADTEHLHWRDEMRRGLGGVIHKVNHIALIVRDVGDSLFFYSDILGFQQIRRPNFDRHGAWLTMGNVELHLIKGNPHTARGQHEEDLIVSHISIECPDMAAVEKRLHTLKEKFPALAWRQNVSVPDPKQSRAQKFENFDSDKGKIKQFFLEDPDGNWIELCDCEKLTKFCFGQDDDGERPEWKLDEIIDGSIGIVNQSKDILAYQEGVAGEAGELKGTSPVFDKVLRWKTMAQERVSKSHRKYGLQLWAVSELQGVQKVAPAEVDAEKLNNLVGRNFTYGDICQGFKKSELSRALALSGNSVPKAIVILRAAREKSGHKYCPPQYLQMDHAGTKVVKTKSFNMALQKPGTSYEIMAPKSSTVMTPKGSCSEHLSQCFEPKTPSSMVRVMMRTLTPSSCDVQDDEFINPFDIFPRKILSLKP